MERVLTHRNLRRAVVVSAVMAMMITVSVLTTFAQQGPVRVSPGDLAKGLSTLDAATIKAEGNTVKIGETTITAADVLDVGVHPGAALLNDVITNVAALSTNRDALSAALKQAQILKPNQVVIGFVNAQKKVYTTTQTSAAPPGTPGARGAPGAPEGPGAPATPGQADAAEGTS